MAGTGAFIGANVKAIGLKQVEAKLVAAAPRILANNHLMVSEMLGYIKEAVEPQMPLGPAHFGYHARDSYKIRVRSFRSRTIGLLKGAAQAYWREFGTLGRFRKGGAATASMARAALYASTVGPGGEPPRPITHHALAGVRKYITLHYGGAAKWWGTRGSLR